MTGKTDTRAVVSVEEIENAIADALSWEPENDQQAQELRHAGEIVHALQLPKLTRGQLAQALDEVYCQDNSAWGADADGDFMPMADAVIERLKADAILEVNDEQRTG